MTECHCSDPRFILELLYGEQIGRQTASLLEERINRFTPLAAPPPLDQGDAILIAYADQFQRQGELPLRTFYHFAQKHLKGVLSGLHLLPFFPYSSDDGFSVIDYRKVKPEWGNWEDIKRLGADFRLMFDLVLNHVSSQSDWFQSFLKGDEQYQDYFISLPPDADLSAVMRPRTSPLMHRFDTAAGPRWVWTTFSADQVDLNYQNPQVLLETVDNVLFYVENCAKLIRLDAVAYLWKEVGTACIHHPKTYLLVNLLNAILKKTAPYVQLVTETNVPHSENVSYFGNGFNAAHLVNNFALPPLVLHAIQTGNTSVLNQWASELTLPSTQVSYFNFLDSHDGIGLRPLQGILSDREINEMVEQGIKHGGLVSSRSSQDGSQSLYELNISFFDALTDPASHEPFDLSVRRFLAAQAVMLSLVGLPGVYVHSLFGTSNWQDGVKQTGQNRSINRRKFAADELMITLSDPGSRQSRVFAGCRQLLLARKKSPAFHPHGAQLVMELNRQVFSILRISPDGLQVVLCLHNLSAQRQEVDFKKSHGLNSGTWRDLFSNACVDLSVDQIVLDGYQVLWLAPENGF